MTVTGTTISDMLFSLQAEVTTAKTIKALNAAITAAWPAIGIQKFANDAVTLVADTPEYILSTLTLDREAGVNEVWITDVSTKPDIRGRQYRQRYDPTTTYWTLIVAPSIYNTYAGKKLSLSYYVPQAAVASLSTAIDLPAEYLFEYVVYWYLRDASGSVKNGGPTMTEIAMQEDRLDRVRKRNKRPVSSLVTLGKDSMA